MEGDRGAEKGVRLHHFSVALVAVVGFAFSFGIHFLFRDIHKAVRAEQLEYHADLLAGVIEQGLTSRLLPLRGLAVDRPSMEEQAAFRRFAVHYGSAFPEMQAIVWMPRVRLVAEGAGARETYPVVLVEPAVGNEALAGIDGGAFADRREAIERARDEGKTIATGPLDLVQGVRQAVIFFLPIYAGGGVPDNVVQRRELFTGVLAVSFRTADLLKSLRGAGRPAVFALDVRDEEAEALGLPSALFRDAPIGREIDDDLAPAARRIVVGERTWRLGFHPVATVLTRHHQFFEWVLLLSGVLATLLLSVFLTIQQTRARRGEMLMGALTATNEALQREIDARSVAETKLSQLNQKLLAEIADRREAEEALRRSEDLFHRALAPSPVTVFAHDRALRYTWLFNSKVKDCNPIGKTDAERFPPADAAVLTAIKREVLETGVIARRTIHLSVNGGMEIDMIVAPVFGPTGQVTGLIGTGIDITPLVRAQDEASRANAAKSRFLAAASHDLRQPLVAGKLFLEQLDELVTTEAQRNCLERAKGSLSATEQLLNVLMDVSALESGKVVPRPSRVRVCRVADRVAAECEPEALAKNLVLRTHFCRAGTCQELVTTDPILLERILRNLANNAIRYTERGQVMVACRQRKDAMLLEVWDTGVGIPEDKFDKVFEDFYQLDSKTVGGGPGLGLGLSTVARMARLLGCRVELRSRVGMGSLFRIVIPMAPPETRPAAGTDGCDPG